jgi:hypothetical protein
VCRVARSRGGGKRRRVCSREESSGTNLLHPPLQSYYAKGTGFIAGRGRHIGVVGSFGRE